MPKHPKFDASETDSGWMVSIPANMAASGKRERRFFPTEDEAKRFGGSLRKSFRDGRRGGTIPHEMAIMAAAAAEMLEPFGASIMDAAKAFVVQAEAAAAETGETFRERYDRAMLAEENNWSAIYAGDMARMERWVGKALMASKCSLVTPQAIAAALGKHGAKARSTIEHRTRYVNAILNHKPRHRKQVRIDIMTVRQCAQMLRACESPEERRAVALLLFAGIRPNAEQGEIMRLDWEAVGEKEIHVDEIVSKTSSDRLIPISGRLKRLIKGHPASGPVIPSNWRRVYKRLRRAAGLTREQDITRHTFASHFLAAHGEKLTKAAMGHTAGSDTLFRHYSRAVNEAAGIKYFA